MKLPCGCEFDEATGLDKPCAEMSQLVTNFMVISRETRIEALFGTPEWPKWRDAFTALTSHSQGLPGHCEVCAALLEGGATVHKETCVFYPYSYHAQMKKKMEAADGKAET